MSRRSRRVGIGTILFGMIVLVLIAAISLLALEIGKRDSDTDPDVTTVESGTDTNPIETNGSQDPDETTDDSNKISVDFSVINEPFAGEWFQHWPAESSVEQLRDSSELMADLIGREFGPGALDGVTVILDPGHGGIDGGTVYPATAPHEIIEKEIVLPISMRVKTQLEELGAEVVMTRTTDEWYSVYYRAAKAGEVVINKLKGELSSTDKDLELLDEFQAQFDAIYNLNLDAGGGEFMGGAGTTEDARLLYDLGRQFPEIIFVSIHNNSWQDSNVGGLQVFYVDNAFQYQFTKTQAGKGDLIPPIYQNYDAENRLRLATTLTNSILKNIPELATVGGIETLKQDGFVVLNRTGLNSIMLELGYVTNANDRANLLNAGFRERIADSITEGIYNYFCQPTNSN